MSGLVPKALSFLALLATAAAVADDTVEQLRNRDDPGVFSKKTKTYIVTFVDNAVSPTERCEALALSMGGFVEHVYDQVLNGCALTFPAAQAQAQDTFVALGINTAVKAVEEDQIVYAFETPSKFPGLSRDADVAKFHGRGRDAAPGNFHVRGHDAAITATETVASWGLDRIDQCTLALDGHTTKLDATGVRVFILDTGIRSDHEEFANGVISNEDCHYSAIPGETALTDQDGHGTHVAGTICGAKYGISSNCKLCVVKVLQANRNAPLKGVLCGINHVVSQCSVSGSDPCVVNMSLGGKYSDALNQAVADAVHKGIVWVVAAGNEGYDACRNSPASEQLAITVGSTNISDQLSSFSNWGSCVDIYAPGSDIISSYIESHTASASLSGTSMASPHVAGIAAAMRSANPSWNPIEIRNAIINNAAPLHFGISLAIIDVTYCSAPVASFLKVELATGMNIHMFEVQVHSLDNNIAAGKSSSQSSTLNNFFASLSVDGRANTFSHTNVATSGSPVWWQVYFGNDYPIESVTVMNRWCGSSADPSGCLCRLSNATLSLIDSEGFVIGIQTIGDTCRKTELLFADFLIPTPSPTKPPYFLPSASLNPTISTLVSDFSWVGNGYCIDDSNQWYSWVDSDWLSDCTEDICCLDWCSQNSHPNLVGVEIIRKSEGMYCACDFSGGVPDDIDISDYSPAAYSKNHERGVGAVVGTDGYSDATCYRYDDHTRSYAASTVKIELGTGKDIHMFEVKVYSSGNNIATGKSSSQSSTLNNFFASLAVDGSVNTFSHTKVEESGSPVWWQVNLGNEFPIQSVTVINRWCGSFADPNGCLCRLSSATVSLIKSEGVVVGTQSTGDTCGKRQLFFDDFVVSPTLAPVKAPSFTPTASINPTSTLVDEFVLVGPGYCQDDLHQLYSGVESPYLPARTTDTYCLDWCSQNPHPDLVGVEVYRGSDGVHCVCDFSGGFPIDFDFTIYSPAASGNYYLDSGTGAILESNGYDDFKCYRYNNYQSVPASIVKIELGTGMNIHMFEVKVYSSGNNIAAGKPSSQSSTLNKFFASLAVDGSVNTFSHTKVEESGSPVWWQVNLGNEFPIQSVTVINRWCGSFADPNGCLCRLSSAVVLLIDSGGVVVGTQSTGDTCGKQQLFFDDFVVPPTPSPVKTPSFTPIASINPTSTLVDEFVFVGQGYCQDDLLQLYSAVVSSYLPSRTTDTYCLDWCSQNPHPDLVGVEVFRGSDGVSCLCDLSGGLPIDFDFTKYSPAAREYYYLDSGTGAILESNGYDDFKCYRYDNYRRSYPASTIKIELGTGKDIHMFEVKVYSSGNNIATGKPSSQSSTLNKFFASLAVDGKVNTFSHTNVASSGSPVWWEIDLVNDFPIESVTVMNRWCGSSLDHTGCLCRLSNATLSLIDSGGAVVGTQYTGDTCVKQELFFNDFLRPPTPAPIEALSYTPSVSSNPTRGEYLDRIRGKKPTKTHRK